MESTHYEAPHCADSSILAFLPLSPVQIFFSEICSATLFRVRGKIAENRSDLILNCMPAAGMVKGKVVPVLN
jgi:hypothetical protein